MGLNLHTRDFSQNSNLSSCTDSQLLSKLYACAFTVVYMYIVVHSFTLLYMIVHGCKLLHVLYIVVHCHTWLHMLVTIHSCTWVYVVVHNVHGCTWLCVCDAWHYCVETHVAACLCVRLYMTQQHTCVMGFLEHVIHVSPYDVLYVCVSLLIHCLWADSACTLQPSCCTELY